MQLTSGTILKNGSYRILSTLGQGGFGITYLALQVGLNRRVAVKEFFMRDFCNRQTDTQHVSVPTESSRQTVDRFRQKFLKEAQTIAAFDHPNIVRIYDIFEENGTAYYVMECLEGGSLSGLPLPMAETTALAYIRQVADALDYIHQRGVLHLDVKPSNILLRNTGTAVLIDFGISKRYDDAGNQTSSTPAGLSKGYAPLEQYNQGLQTFTPATDVYSLGATLYRLLTGQTPPEASVVNEEGLPPCPANVAPHIYEAITCAMQPRRKDRLASIAQFVDMLDAKPSTPVDDATVIQPDPVISKETPSKPQPTPTPTPQPQPASTGPRKRRPNILWAAVAGIAVLAGIITFALWKNSGLQSGVYDPIAQIEKDMVYVEGGTFIMGETLDNDYEADEDEKPAHRVTLSSFYICKHEVTKAEFIAVMGYDPAEYDKEVTVVDTLVDEYYEDADELALLDTIDFESMADKDYPVTCVTWYECQEFIKRLNEITGKNYRLPTEAEWEYAARGGKKSKGYIYSGSKLLYDVAWYEDNSDGEAHQVMTKQPNELGLYDMSGNVDEWCQDWYDDYQPSPQTDPKGPASGKYRVQRGGDWYFDAEFSRVLSRSCDSPTDYDEYVGFRLAR